MEFEELKKAVLDGTLIEKLPRFYVDGMYIHNSESHYPGCFSQVLSDDLWTKIPSRGIYFLMLGNIVTYIGISGCDISRRLDSHSSINEKIWNWVMIWESESEKIKEYERWLIRTIWPYHNISGKTNRNLTSCKTQNYCKEFDGLIQKSRDAKMKKWGFC